VKIAWTALLLLATGAAAWAHDEKFSSSRVDVKDNGVTWSVDVSMQGLERVLTLPAGPVELRVEVDEERMYFGYRLGGGAWQWLPQQFDASILSDEATAPGLPNFTGAFVGMACQDMAGTALHADFDWFEYRERAFADDPRA
jgi:beta-xylosidase